MNLRNPQEIEAKVAARFRVFLMLWAAIFISVSTLTILAFVIPGRGTPNPLLSYALAAAGVTMFGASFLLKQALAQRAIDKSDIAGLQSAHVVSLALCESPAIFGLVNHLVTGSKITWLLFAVAAVGILMHFPNREQIRNVSYNAN